MAVRGFTMLPSYYEAIRPLSDAERLAMYDAIMDYVFTSKVPEGLSPILNGYFTLLRPNIDSSVKHYSASVENGEKGGRPPKKKAKGNPQKTQQKPSGNREKETEKEVYPPLSPLRENSPELNAVFSDWLAYKAEKRQGYTPTGLKTLIARVEAAAKEHGEKAVADVIRDSMAANWQGIAFDRLKKEKPSSPVSTPKQAPVGRLVKLEDGSEVMEYA